MTLSITCGRPFLVSFIPNFQVEPRQLNNNHKKMRGVEHLLAEAVCLVLIVALATVANAFGKNLGT